MASVKSLGIYKPTALPHLLEEQIIPSDNPGSHYTWDITCDASGGTDELLITQDSVSWSRGGIFQKCFRFELEKEPVTHALLAYFPASSDSQDTSGIEPEKHRPASQQNLSLSKALVVFLRTQAHFFFLEGTSHVIHMPFEVETAFAAPRGIIIQRKQRTDSSVPVTLKFPRVPPNSFVSSQLSPLISPAVSQQAFSIERLGKPKSLPFRLSNSIGPVFDTPVVEPDSHWPRLVCLTDPLLQMGLVVSQVDPPATARRKFSGKGPWFLDPSEELLHIEEIQVPDGTPQIDGSSLVIAVTLNRDTSSYTVWKVSYLKPDEKPFARPRNPASKSNRRRSSMQPGLRSGATTPLAPSFRESFGAPLPGKRDARKSERHEKPVDIASTIQADRDGNVARRQSRRVSSMLARVADLSASQDRSIFDGGKRIDSHGSQYHRQSSGAHGSFNILHSNHLEAPVDDLLDELRSGGDFEGFHSMGLDDHDFEGISQEIMFSKIHSVPIDHANFRYSASSKPAKKQCKVFILVGSPFTADEHQRNQLIIAIQDTNDRRLQLLAFHLQKQRKFDLSSKAHTTETLGLVWSHLRKAQEVVDCCKVMDGNASMMLILSRGKDGHDLSIQAPWSKLFSIRLPLLQNSHMDFLVTPTNKHDMLQEKPTEPLYLPASKVIGFLHSARHGIVNLKDDQGRCHQIQIQLEPRNPIVKRVLDTCRSILPASHAEHILFAWWSIFQWLKAEQAPFHDFEWSCTVVLLFCIYLGLRPTDNPFSHVPRRNLRGDIFASFTLDHGDPLHDWARIQPFEAPNATLCPGWMQSQAWEWMLNEEDGDMVMAAEIDLGPKNDFISRHIVYTKQFLSSAIGMDAAGPSGYLPTAAGRGKEIRRSAAWDIFMALHLLMEEMKLDIMTPEYQSPGRADLRVVLCQIARWLGWTEFAKIYELGIQEEIDPSHDADVALVPPLPEPGTQFCIFSWIQARLVHRTPAIFLTLPQIYHNGSNSTDKEMTQPGRWRSITPRTFMFKELFDKMDEGTQALGLVEALHACGFDRYILDTLPDAILTPLQDAISLAQPCPPPTWPTALLELINRSDVSAMLTSTKPKRRSPASLLPPTHTATWDYSVICKSVAEFTSSGYNEDGSAERQAVIRALFHHDRRLDEAKNLLNTSRPRTLNFSQDPNWSEAIYLEKQKELVTQIAIGTLAIPSGRGLLYYSLRFPLLTQKYAIQGFNLNCVIRPNNTTVGVDKSMYAEEKVSWAFFHQGVAGGLAISPNAQGIDTSWILYNKPGQDLSNRHAGFLLALGLNGHLKSVAKWVAFKYLTPKHTMTSIGLLLGLAASYLGTMDSLITRLLSVHVTRMLPRGAAELNLSPLTQTTGIIGIGLLYANTQHRRMSEIMVSEISHIEPEEEEEPLRSECYRLAAGFSLGLINLARGTNLRGLADMRLTETLLSLATSTKKVDIVPILDRAAAPAAVAIALIYMRTEDQIVARKIDVPSSTLQFEYIRPDVLLLRTMAKNLIMWSKIEPTFRWIRTNVPSEFQSRYRLCGVQKLVSSDMPFYAIIAGLCFSLALRFSGSANIQVRDLLVHYTDQFRRISKLPTESFDARLARAGTAMALDTVALSASVVMAGTGDLVVLRRLRALHGREDDTTNYGSHLAAHLAIGALFLGSGTKTFGNSPMATAALIIAFYPVWPKYVMDNRAHLQATRHFWTLAVEDRCLVAREIGGGVVSIGVIVKLKKNTVKNYNDKQEAEAGKSSASLPTFGGSSLTPIASTHVTPALSSKRVASPIPMEMDEGIEPEELQLTTPTLLPPLETIASIQTVAAPTFWDLTLDFETNPGLREQFATSGMSLYLRRRPVMEGPMEGTIRTLGGKTIASDDTVDPIEWVFENYTLNSLTAMEKAAILEDGEDDIAGCGSGRLAQAVDTRLMLRNAMAGKSREDLLGLRLLFAWERERRRFLVGDSTLGNHDQSTAEKKDKIKDIISPDDVDMEDVARSVDVSEDKNAIPDDEDTIWWLRSTAIDEIRGKVYLGDQC